MRIMFLLLITGVIMGLSVGVFAADEVCEDGTPRHECSTVHPGMKCSDYLDNGVVKWTLIHAAKVCGCPEGYQMVVTDDAPAGKCIKIGNETSPESNQTEGQTEGEEQSEQESTGYGNNQSANETLGQSNQTVNETGGSTSENVTSKNEVIDKYKYEPVDYEEPQGGLCAAGLIIPMVLLGYLARYNR
ncbi:hypothetical protein J7K41_02645 [Candidatus Micrarchaeota archaeon]|nr:hypothetical protein [Candidatus Micrarchaeota archaeon]